MKTAIKILLILLCAAGIVVNFAILVADGYSKQPWLGIGLFVVCIPFVLIPDKIVELLLSIDRFSLSLEYKNADSLEPNRFTKVIYRYLPIILIISGWVDTLYLLSKR